MDFKKLLLHSIQMLTRLPKVTVSDKVTMKTSRD